MTDAGFPCKTDRQGEQKPVARVPVRERRRPRRFRATLDAEYTKVEGGLKILWVSSQPLLRDCVAYAREIQAAA